MGRKRKRLNDSNYKKLSKQRPKFWVEKCKGLKPKKGVLLGAMTLIITRSEVQDHFMVENESKKKDEINHASVEVVNGSDKEDATAEKKTKHESLDIGDESAISKEKDNTELEKQDYNHTTLNVDQEIISQQIEQLQKSTSLLVSRMTADETLTEDQHQQVKKAAMFPPPVLIEANDVKDQNETILSSCITEDISPKPIIRKIHTNQVSAEKSEASLKTSSCEKKLDQRKPFIRVIRAASAKMNKQGNHSKHKRRKTKHKNLPNGDCGDGIINPYPSSEVADKYWAQRRRLFSKYDEGIMLDKESWYSITPEAIANHLTKRIVDIFQNENSSERTGMIMLDPFCGCGGNGISFAKHSDVHMTVCVDIDIEKLKMAANNASIYGIDTSRIIFILADASDVMKCYQNGENILNKKHDETPLVHMGYTIGLLEHLPQRIDCIFLSPPWGGPDYGVNHRDFDLKHNISISHTDPTKTGTKDQLSSDEIGKSKKEENAINGDELLSTAASASRNKMVVLFLPRNLNGVSLGRSALEAGYRGSIEFEQNVLNDKLKTITVYLGKNNSKLLRGEE